MAHAFAHTFWWAVGTIMIAFIPTLFLPNHAAAPRPAHAEVGADGESPVGDAEPGPRTRTLLD